MKLYLLRPRENLTDSPWEPWYDKAFGFVVRAEDEKTARTIANGDSGDERWQQEQNPWLDESLSTCVELLPEGEQGIVIKDFAGA